MVNKRGIYKFSLECRRSADIEGIFLAYEYDVRDLVGVTIYFGEISGKHSEVIREIDHGDIKLVTDDLMAVHLFEKYKMETGINPFDYFDNGYE